MTTEVTISKKLVAINSASSVVARLLNVSVLIWMHQYLLRRISPDEYSLLPVLMAVMVFAPLLTNILTSGLGRYIVESYAKGDERGVIQIVSTMFFPLLGAGILVLAGGLVFSWYIDHILKIAPHRLWDARIMMSLLILSLAIRLPLAPFGVGLHVKQKFVIQNMLNVSAELFRITLLCILLIGISPRVLWVVVASVTAEVCRLMVRMNISRRLVPQLKLKLSEINWSRAKEIISFGIWNFLGDIARMIQSAANPILLNELATPMDVTCFYVGSIPYRQFGSWHSLVYNPLLPPLTAMHASGNKLQMRNTYLRGGRYGLWAAVLFALPLIVFRNEVIHLYIGDKFIIAAEVMALLLVTFPVSIGQEILFSIAHASAQIHRTTRRVLIIRLVNLALAIYMVGVLKMGAIGAALALMVTEIAGMLILIYPLAFDMTDVSLHKWLKRTFAPGILPGIPAAAIWYGLKFLVHPTSWIGLGLCVAAGAICYLVVLLTFALQENEREDLKLMLYTIKKIIYPRSWITQTQLAEDDDEDILET